MIKSLFLAILLYSIKDNFLTDVGVVFSRSQLLHYLRGDDGFEISERAIDVQIVNLRRKLGDFGSNIETVRGMGYKHNNMPRKCY